MLCLHPCALPAFMQPTNARADGAFLREGNYQVWRVDDVQPGPPKSCLCACVYIRALANSELRFSWSTRQPGQGKRFLRVLKQRTSAQRSQYLLYCYVLRQSSCPSRAHCCSLRMLANVCTLSCQPQAPYRDTMVYRKVTRSSTVCLFETEAYGRLRCKLSRVILNRFSHYN